MKLRKCNPPAAEDYHFIVRQDLQDFTDLFLPFFWKGRRKIIRLILLILSDFPVFAFNLHARRAEVDQQAYILLQTIEVVNQLDFPG